MNTLLFFVFTVVLAVFGLKQQPSEFIGAPQRPVISEVFEATVTVETDFNGKHDIGEGGWAVNQPAGKAVEDYRFFAVENNLYFLQRYDLHEDFQIASANGTCQTKAVTGTMPAWWGWISQAEYKGDKKVFHTTLDLWEAKIGHVKLGVAVAKDNANVPLWFGRESADEKFQVEIFHFKTTINNKSWFDVPKQCPSSKEEKVEEKKIVAAPQRPSISPSFEAFGEIDIKHSGKKYLGGGFWAVDQPKGKGNQFFEFKDNNGRDDIYLLERYDLHKDYMINSKNITTCKVTPVTGSMKNPWAWIANADFKGTKTIFHQTYDLWEYTTGGTTFGVAVDQFDPNTPHWYGTKSSTEEVGILFFRFETNYINQTLFDVPKECN